jgi:hypothetical protein
MQYAPFLLQAFAARVLASKENETLARDDLKKHGYDVEMLVEMIAEYASLPEGERAFVATATDTQIFLARKANLPAPLPPMMTVPQGATVAPVVGPQVPTPTHVSLAGLVSRAERTANERSASK